MEGNEAKDHLGDALEALERIRRAVRERGIEDAGLDEGIRDLSTELSALERTRGQSGRLRAVRDLSDSLAERASGKDLPPLDPAGTALEWEASHPRISALLLNLADTLQRLGI